MAISHPVSPVDRDLDTARGFVAALASDDVEAAERYCHPDLEFHDAWAVGSGMYCGPAGMRQLHDDFDAAWDQHGFELLELELAPDGRVFVGLVTRARLRATGHMINRPLYFVLTFRDGKLYRWDGWHLRAVARGSAGLPE
jgi:ketosteroid isomerase-like protein